MRTALIVIIFEDENDEQIVEELPPGHNEDEVLEVDETNPDSDNESYAMEPEPNYCYKKDENIKYSNKDFADLLNNKSYNSDLASCIPFPSDYLLAQFSDLAYSEAFENLPTGWEFLTTARNKKLFHGYFGVCFWNPKLCQIVVAHRGTVPSNFGALYSDAMLSIGSKRTNQAESATTFVYKVGEIIKSKMNNDGSRYQLSITGHSLGAWLAQMTTYTLKYFTLRDGKFVEDHNYSANIHAHTVVFESPGCKKNMEELCRHFVPSYIKRRFGNYYSLDMTVYLSEINAINSINEHVGSVYKIQSKTHAIKDVLQQFDSKTGEIKKELVLNSKSGFFAALKAVLKPITKVDFKTVTANANQHSLNVFDENEEDFIRDWIYVRDFQPDSIKTVKNPLPHFEVDYEYDLIKGDNIIKTIALIKNYKTSKTFMSNVLSANVLFKMRTDQFKNNLVQYTKGFYIKDKYRLKEFLVSDTQILNISVKADLEDGYRLETSVLNNICTFYKMKDESFTSKYSFISWDLLKPLLEKHKLLFENLDTELLVLECGALNTEDVANINKLIEDITFKIIIISVDSFPFRNNNLQKVDGFSHAIIFNDLEVCSQEKLIEQKRIIINNKSTSIKSLLQFNENTYKHLNSALPSDLLLQVLTTSDTEYLVLNATYRNILNGITIELHKEIDANRKDLGTIDNALVFIEQEDLKESETSIAEGSNIFSPKIGFEKKCLDSLSSNSNKTIYLFKQDGDKVFLSKIFRSDLYIQRDVANLRFLKSTIFKDGNTDQIFYVCGNQKLFQEMSAKSDLDRYIFVAEEDAKIKLQQTNSWAHVLKINNDKTIRLLGSTGNVQILKQHVVIEEISETQLANDNVVILSGDPGVGKTSVIKMLYLRFQKTHWIFVIQLVNANFDNLVLNYNNIAKFILNTCGNGDEYLQFLLSFSLRHPTNMPIYLLFDGFDRVLGAESKQKFMEMINILKYSPSVKILITTQTYTCKELENGIGVLASYFLPTQVESNIISYLTKFWYSQLQVLDDTINSKDLEDRAKSILKTASEFFEETIPTFLGIPLHIRIMAEISAPNATSINHESVFADFLLPYEKLIETYCDTYFKRCGFPDNSFLKEIAMDGIYKKLYALAMIQMFSFDLDFKTKNDIEELIKIGLIQPSVNILKFSFMHDTLRDYFVAHLVREWLDGKLVCCDWEIDSYIIRNFLLEDHHKEIRIFLNCHLRNTTASLNTLTACRERLKKLYTENHSSTFNEERSFYHICLNENLDFLFKNFLVELIEDEDVSTALLCKRNFDLKTPLYLLIENNDTFDEDDENSALRIFLEKINRLPYKCIKSILLSTFFTYFATKEQFSKIIQISNVYENIHTVLLEIEEPFSKIEDFLSACRRNKSKDVIKLLQTYNDDLINRYLVMVTNNKKQTGLHITISEKIISEMLKFGADLNLRDHNGLTPLIRAIKGGNTKIALTLIEKGADPDLSDTFNNSPLMHAIKHGNEEIVAVLLNSDQVDVKKYNRFGMTTLMQAARQGNKNIVSLLLDRRVPVNDVDQTGLSALFHCIKTKQIHLVKILKRYGADLDLQDLQGVTPLLDSIKKSNWNAVNTLLDNEAEPFIHDFNDEQTIKLLVQKEKSNVLTKMFRISKINSDHINRYKNLTQNEKAYIHKYVFKTLTS
ncbi:hypothetical protein FQR65_LT13685 [Abscondita terminalis]|nr:hypothetical protein FQR65_LT13685 [Abscondita terminalis]